MAQLKIKVNETEYDIEIFGDKAVIDGKETSIEIKDDNLVFGDKEFCLDFYDEQEEESLLIINGLAFMVSKKSPDYQTTKEIKAYERSSFRNINSSQFQNRKRTGPCCFRSNENVQRGKVTGKRNDKRCSCA